MKKSEYKSTDQIKREAVEKEKEIDVGKKELDTDAAKAEKTNQILDEFHREVGQVGLIDMKNIALKGQKDAQGGMTRALNDHGKIESENTGEGIQKGEGIVDVAHQEGRALETAQKKMEQVASSDGADAAKEGMKDMKSEAQRFGENVKQIDQTGRHLHKHGVDVDKLNVRRLKLARDSFK